MLYMGVGVVVLVAGGAVAAMRPSQQDGDALIDGEKELALPA
jgi:hypothetical protein